MPPDEAILNVLDAFHGADVPYMIVGSLASNFHGIPRSTRDAGFVVQFAPGRFGDLASRLAPGLSLSPQGPFETVTGTTRLLIELAGSAFACELFLLSDDPHDRGRFARRIGARLLGRSTFVASVEDTIVTKLRWAATTGRSRDRDDIRNVLAVRGADLDWAYLHK